MPTTITSFNVFVPQTVIESARMNQNFSNYRGTLIPINPAAENSTDGIHDLGTSEHRWRWVNLSIGPVIYGGTIPAAVPTNGVAIINQGGELKTVNHAGTVLPLGGAESVRWNKFSIGFGAVPGGATNSVAVPLFVAQPGDVIHGYRIKQSVAFGGSLGSVNFKLGDAADPIKFIPNYTASDAVTSTAQFSSSDFVIYNETTTIYYGVSLGGGNLSGLSAGALDIWILKSTLP